MRLTSRSSIAAAVVTLALLCGDAAAAMTFKRQSGPVDPNTDPDCTYYDTAYDSSNDCAFFESYWGLSHTDFVAWNPSVLDNCSGIKIGNSYCVEVTRKPTTTTTTTTGPTQSPKPSPTQDGLIESCTTFYKAIKADTCDKIVSAYGTFTKAQFIEWNPAVEEDCSGIWADTYYCVGIPGTPTRNPTTTTTMPTGSPKPSPTQDGLIDTCTRFYKAEKGDTCDEIVSAYGTFTKAQFITWNPAVEEDCSGIWADTYYCVGIPGTPTSPPTTTPTGSPKPSPTQDGLIDTCTRFYKAVKGDDCDKIIKAYGTFTKAEFIKWNPAVDNDCSGLQAEVYYCVGIPGTPTKPPTTTTTKATTTTKPGNGITTPTPTQEGMVSNCDAFYFVKNGDDCKSIADSHGITVAQFTTWNSKVGGAGCPYLWLDTYYCVSIVGHTPTTTTTKKTTTTTTTTTTTATCKTAHPAPTQPGSVCQCTKWYLPAKDEYCADIEKKFGITAAQFNKWNPKIGSDCKGLYAGYNVCVKGT